jgi:hypothetical protein
MNEGILKVLLSVVIVAVLFIAPGCKKDCRLMYEKLLTEQQKKQIPFEGRERISFKNDTNIFELNGTGRFDTIKKLHNSGYSCDYYTQEYDFLTFEGENINLNLLMTGRDIFNISLDDFSQDFHMLASLRTDQSTGELLDYEELIDSLIVNNSLYLNIYKDTVDVSYPINGDDSDSIILATYIYYSTDFGVVKIDFSDGSSWELEKIEWNLF